MSDDFYCLLLAVAISDQKRDTNRNKAKTNFEMAPRVCQMYPKSYSRIIRLDQLMLWKVYSVFLWIQPASLFILKQKLQR